MKNILVLVFSALVLTGCLTGRQPERVVVPRPVLVEIPEDLLRCSGVRWPNPDTLTDSQVSQLLVDLERARARCGANIEAIRQLQDRIKLEMEGRGLY